jgi:hypothetical protein
VKVVFRHFDARDIHFHLDDVGVNAVNGGTQGFIEHIRDTRSTRRRQRGWEILADIIARANPECCDGHHPVTVMERDGTFCREPPLSVLR